MITLTVIHQYGILIMAPNINHYQSCDHRYHFFFNHFLLFNIVNHYDPMIVMIDNYDTNQFETAPNLSLAV